MRRALWRPAEPHFADDCNSPLNVIEQGYRGVYDPEASAREVAAESSEGLMRRRVRMVTRDLEATLSRPALLVPGLLVLQAVCYRLSLAGYLLQGKSRSRWLSLALYFGLSNLPTSFGLGNELRQGQAVTWQLGGIR